MHSAAPRHDARGMTLIEILVVLVIIGILAMLATLSVGILGEDREIEEESRRLADSIALLQEQAQLEGRDYGILLETGRYEFQRFDAFEQRWKPVENDKALSARELPPDLALELVLEGRPVLLRREANAEARLPQLVAWGSGDMTPYRLTLSRRAGARITLVGALDGAIEIERGNEDDR
jgi:general secretion pathway protein H